MDLLFQVIAVILIVAGGVAGQSIVKSPADTTGTIGETAKLLCVVDYGEHVPTVTWKFNKKIICLFKDNEINYPFGTNKYVVTNSHTIFTLEVRNLNYSDGGDYICEVMGQKKSAVLIILGSPVITPVKTDLMEGKTATFTCEARFGGPSIDTISPDLHPQMELFLDDVIFQTKRLSHLQDKFLIQKVYDILVDDSMDKKELKCAIGANRSTHLISSTTLNIHYSVRNITYSPQEEGTYVYGQYITCSARGNPFPLLEWRNKQNPEMVIKGPLLHIADDMKGENSWTCTARNSVGGRMYEDEITATFEAASTIENAQDKACPGWHWPLFGVICFACFAAGVLGPKAYQSETARHIREMFANWVHRRNGAETEHNGDQERNADNAQEKMIEKRNPRETSLANG